MAKVTLVLTALFVLAYAPAFSQRAAIEFITEDLPWAVVDKGYSPAPLEVRVSGRCPLGGVGYTVMSGALPPGILLSKLGYFSGTPSRNGSFDFTVRYIVVTGAALLSAT